jgi:starch synthase (maltosyl-transferring)
LFDAQGNTCGNDRLIELGSAFPTNAVACDTGQYRLLVFHSVRHPMGTVLLIPTPEADRGSRRPLRLLFVITDLDVGGAEKFCVQLATGLDRSSWSPAVCCLSRPGAAAEPLAAAGVPVYSLDARSYWHAPATVLRLAWLMRQVRPAIVHTILFHANVVGRLAARLAGVRRVISSIRVAERRYAHHLVLENLTCRLAQRILCVSGAVARYVRRHAHLPAAHLAVVPNGVDADEVGAATPVDRATLGLPPDASVAAFVGRLDPQKGVDMLLRAAALAMSQLPQLHLVLAGAGPERDALVQLARQLGIQSRAHFLGLRSDVPSLLRAADLFVLSSRWEGMPNAVLEAMAAGLPVVATRTEGTTELVREGETGLLVDIDDCSGLARALVCVAADPSRRADWGSAARQLVRREYSVDRMIVRYEQLYDGLFCGPLNVRDANSKIRAITP